MSWGKHRKVQNLIHSKKEINKDVNESVATISYKMKFIDTARFMAILLSNLVDNPTEGIHKIKCKERICNKDFSNKIDEELKKRFKKTLKFSNNDINHFFCC